MYLNARTQSPKFQQVNKQQPPNKSYVQKEQEKRNNTNLSYYRKYRLVTNVTPIIQR